MIENAAESILETSFLILMPFLMAASLVTPGWHKKEIKDQDPVISYQMYVTELKADPRSTPRPLIVYLKDRGGKLTTEEVNYIEKQADLKGQIFLIPKSQNSEWEDSEIKNLHLVLEKVLKYRNIDNQKIVLMTQNSASSLGVKLVCSEKIKFSKAYILNYKGTLPENCPVQETIQVNSEESLKLWTFKSNSVSHLPVKSLVELLKI